MEINANKKQAVKAEGCTISNIKKIGKDISFDYLAEALPYPWILLHVVGDLRRVRQKL